MGGATTVKFLITQNPKRDKAIIWITEISSRQREFEFLNVIFYVGFAQKVPVR